MPTLLIPVVKHTNKPRKSVTTFTGHFNGLMDHLSSGNRFHTIFLSITMFLDIKSKDFYVFFMVFMLHIQKFSLHRLLPLLWLKRNISNFSYAGDVTLVAENGEKLKSLLMR